MTKAKGRTHWFSFRGRAARGRVGVSRGVYGPDIHLGHLRRPEEAVGCVDLYHHSPCGRREGGAPGGPVSLLFFSSGLEAWAVRLVYDREGNLEVVVNAEWLHSFEAHPHGEHPGGDHVFRPPVP